MNDLALNFQSDFNDILQMIADAPRKAAYQVNATMIDLYWGIGEFVSHKAMQDGWGRSTVKALSEYILTQEVEYALSRNMSPTIESEDRTPLLIEQLLIVWESSVKTTHLFLSEEEIENIKNYVPQALKEIPRLIIIENENQIPVGFMGIVEQHLEMLFIAHEERGKGLGKDLLKYGIEKYSVNDLAVNEQNPLAKGFYEHMGFAVYKRTACDEQGNPYPLLCMRLSR